MDNKEKERRYHLAEQVEELCDEYLWGDPEHTALMEAVKVISPEYYKEVMDGIDEVLDRIPDLEDMEDGEE